VNGEKKKVGELRLTRPCDVLFEGVDTEIYKPLDVNKIKSDFKNEIEEVLKDESFVYLHVGLWGNGDYGEDRKNISLMIKTFYEAFSNDPKEPTPALVLKTNGADFSLLDRHKTLKNIRTIKNKFDGLDKVPNVYLLHGDLTIQQMAILYNLPKIKAFLTCTHGEGFGRPMLEASCCDLPVIATNWSGQLDFLNDSESLFIEGKLEKVPKSMVWKPIIEEQAQWYSVSEVDVKRKVRLFYNNSKVITNKAKVLGKKNRDNFSLNAMSKEFNDILDEVLKEVEAMPKQVELKLPKLKKIGKGKKLKLPNLKKV
jgi:glycosyltransferase involved in cell wall biosynthesis